MEEVSQLINGTLHATGASFELGTLGDAKSLVTALENAAKWKAEELRQMKVKHMLLPRERSGRFMTAARLLLFCGEPA
jgi:hypothetical protein